MKVVAFDAKDFNRSRVEQRVDRSDPSSVEKRYRGFFSPLGVGVTFKDADGFQEEFLSTNGVLKKEFEISNELRFLSSNQLKKDLNMSKAIAYSNKLIDAIQDQIESIHVSYVVLPPKDRPEVKVGGSRCPLVNLRTEEFVRSLGPMFSYISAWNYMRRKDGEEYELMIDGFRSKNTIAWDELSSKCSPTIFSHGDECNPFISISDMIAFLTDTRLYHRKPGPATDPMLYRGLRPDNVHEVWEDCSFKTDCRFLDHKVLTKFTWYDDQLIDTTSFMARPIVFFLVDQLEKIPIAEPHVMDGPSPAPSVPISKKFSKTVQYQDPFHAALIYAERLGGCVQFYDRFSDSDKVRDGDVLVYMGDNSKKVAQTLADGFDIEMIKAKDLRKKIKSLQDK
ncbi:hypothetical protein DSECCO2_228500 [anaerobic digester metagenome]|nr:hypothetical protein [Methanomassiliicoccales archaeon]